MIAAQRRASRWLGLGLFVLAALALWLAGGDIRELASASARQAPRVTVSLGAATAPGAGFAVLVLAVMLFLPPSSRWQRRLFGAALGGLSLAVILPLALSVWADHVLPERGYRACRGGQQGMRFPTYDWVHGAKTLCRTM